jgi:hypothetical protein
MRRKEVQHRRRYQKKTQGTHFANDGYKGQINNQARYIVHRKLEKELTPWWEGSQTYATSDSLCIPKGGVMNPQKSIKDENQDSQQKDWLVERAHNPQ